MSDARHLNWDEAKAHVCTLGAAFAGGAWTVGVEGEEGGDMFWFAACAPIAAALAANSDGVDVSS